MEKLTREEIEQCKHLQEKLYQRCKEICAIFRKYSYKYELIEKFEFFDDNEIYGWGCEGDVELYIPIDYLLMTDEELYNVVDEKINERDENERITREENKRVQEEKERQMYETLKQKYGSNETINNKVRIPVNIVKRGK